MDIKKILALTDFSNAANNALLYAADIAAQCGAQIEIVHAFTQPVLTARGKPVLPEQDDIQADLKIVEAQLEKTKELVSEKHNVPISSNTLFINWQMDFAEAVHGLQADLIVMGTTGASGLEKMFVGSNTAHIIQHSVVPVLAIPEGAKLSQHTKIGFAYDGLQLKEIEKLAIVNSLKNVLGASVHVFRVMNEKQPPSPHLSLLMNFLQGAVYSDVYESEVESGILKSIELNRLDMLVMMPRQHGFFHNLISGSTTEKVAYKISIPLLAIPE